jgi:tRNA-2-methylthio-N6-dimethylallyladenosine synthase
MGQLDLESTPVDLDELVNREGDLGDGRKVYIETYGCQMNVADSELMAGVLLGKGYELAPNAEDADVILVNTCAVREKAEERVVGRMATLNGLKKTKKHLKLGMTGCMAEHLREKIGERAPFVDMVVGPDAYRRLPELIAQTGGPTPVVVGRSGKQPIVSVPGQPLIDVRLDKGETYEGLDPVRQGGVGTWVTIQRGCDKFCTFCIVPFTRGRERGVAPREILRQCREAAAHGYKEVTLLGQTVNSYVYEDVDFADLVTAVAAIDGIQRVRFTSPYPVDFTPKLIEVMAREDKVCNYIHLPVQSGNDKVLAEMKRGYTLGEYRKLVHDIRAAIPNMAISTDIIVGFPAETEGEFRDTVELVREMRYDFAYMFKYSEREGTLAHKRIADDIPEKVKGRRLAELIAIQEAICKEKTAPYIGRDVEVLIADRSRKSEDDWSGRTDTFKNTIFPKVAGSAVGQVVTVRIHDATSHTLLGTQVP